MLGHENTQEWGLHCDRGLEDSKWSTWQDRVLTFSAPPGLMRWVSSEVSVSLVPWHEFLPPAYNDRRLHSGERGVYRRDHEDHGLTMAFVSGAISKTLDSVEAMGLMRLWYCVCSRGFFEDFGLSRGHRGFARQQPSSFSGISLLRWPSSLQKTVWSFGHNEGQ